MTPKPVSLHRETLETKVTVELDLSCGGQAHLKSPLPFLNHMLSQLSKHAQIFIGLQAEGDVDVDPHHLIEDIGIVLGEALNQSLGDKRGISRFGWAMVPMDDALATVAIDLSGRPFIVYRIPIHGARVGTMDADLIEEFLRAFAFSAKVCLHVNVPYAHNPHDMIEAAFKALALALRQAIRNTGSEIPSTKGVL
jgi:imidazoleglycerol-phosphate dehydratase